MSGRNGARTARPSAPESELFVLGGLMLVEDPQAILAQLAAEDFTTDQNRRLLAAVNDVVADGREPTPAAVADQLGPDLERVGGRDFIVEAMHACAAPLLVDEKLRVVRDHTRRRRLREELAAGIGAIDSGAPFLEALGVTEQGIERLRSAAPADRRLLDDVEIEQLSDPDFLVHGILPVGGFSVLYGPPGSGKTFVALDWAMCIATGFRWQQREVRRGQVVYVSGEGGPGLKSRVRAWKAHREFSGRAGVHFLREAVTVLDPADLQRFIHEVRQLDIQPNLVVLDTLARCFAGGDENSTADMSNFVAGVDRIRTQLETSVLVVHHSNKSSGSERGNTALRGAADTMTKLTEEDEVLHLSCDKQKDAEPFPRLDLRLMKEGRSCVVVPDTEACQAGVDRLTRGEMDALLTLTEIDVGGGVTVSEWVKAADVVERTIYRARKTLVDRELITADKPGRGARYSVTAAGREALNLTT